MGHSPKVRADFFIDIFQARRNLYIFGHGKRQPHCLTGLMIRVLSEDYDFDVIQVREKKTTEDFFTGREDRISAVISFFSSAQSPEKYDLRISFQKKLASRSEEY